MAFLDENFMKKDQEENEIINEALNNNQNEMNNQMVNNNQELEINRKNRVEYEELMKDSETKLDMYYDKNNVFVKLLLLGLFVFIVLGVAYYVLMYLAK